MADFFNAVGLNPREFVFRGLPTEYDLLSWRKLREGRRTARDIVLLLGNMFADISAPFTEAWIKPF
jgi:hypothetical protein